MANPRIDFDQQGFVRVIVECWDAARHCGWETENYEKWARNKFYEILEEDIERATKELERSTQAGGEEP